MENIYTYNLPLARFEFDSRTFSCVNPGSMNIPMAPYFDIAYRSRRGDEAAIAVAKAIQLYITDIDGATYVDYR